jgi:transcriptional regulator with XRE-family HTH domain
MPPDRVFVALGLVIRRHREDGRFTQEAFANANSLGLSYYSKIERGDHNLTLANFLRIAHGLDLPASTLLREAERLDLQKALKRPPNPPRRGRPPGSHRRT